MRALMLAALIAGAITVSAPSEAAAPYYDAQAVVEGTL